MTTEDNTSVQDTKKALAEKKLSDERDKARQRGSRGVTDNALRGMNSTGNVNADSTGNVVDVNNLKAAETIDIDTIKHRFQAKTQTIVELFANTGYSVVIRSFTDGLSGGENSTEQVLDKDKPLANRFFFAVSIYDGDVSVHENELMALTISIYSDNTANVFTKSEGEFDIAPVIEAVGNSPVLDRVFYDFKKQARDSFLRDIIDKRNEEVQALYAPKSKAKKRPKKKETTKKV